ncbi:MAG TPA: transglutaminase-like domain-containing protein [Acidimicrobiia bacterium]|nr:transglutaminase-like domain-containing protein [Acidimicrobiia bacterium]
MQFVDSDHPAVIAFAERATAGATTDRDKAVALYYAVRDGIRYDPYTASANPADYTGSAVLEAGSAYCIPKAVLLCAAARAVGLTCRLGFADVRNHLTTEKLRQRMKGSDLFPWHGFVEFRLDGRWVKATPAFNIELCERFGVLPLEFDGEHDSLLHPFTVDGRDHMEYVNDRGTFDELPFDDIMRDLLETMDVDEPPPADTFRPA